MICQNCKKEFNTVYENNDGLLLCQFCFEKDFEKYVDDFESQKDNETFNNGDQSIMDVLSD